MNAEKRVGTTVPRLAIMVFAGSLGYSGIAADAASWWWNFNVGQEPCPASYPERSGGASAAIVRGSDAEALPETQPDSRGEAAYCTDGSSSSIFTGVDVTGSVPLFGQNAAGTGISGRFIQVSDIGSRLLKNVDGKMPSFTVEIVCRQPAIDGRIAENRLLYLWGNDFSLGIEKFCWGGNGGWPYGWGLHGVRGSNWNYISKNDANVALFPEDGKWHHVALVYDAANETVAVFTDYQQKVQVKIDSPFGGTENIWYLEVANGNTSRGPQQLTVDELKVTAAALGATDFLRTAKVVPMNFDFDFEKAAGSATYAPTDARGNAVLVGSALSAKNFTPGIYFADGQKSSFVTSAASFSTTDCRLDDSVFHGLSSFTLEAVLSASSDGSVFSCGTDWSLVLSGGRLVWRHGSAESVLAEVTPNTWHGIALRYEPNGDAAAYSVFLDGDSAGAVADMTQLAAPTLSSLALGSGLTALVGRFRATPEVLPAEALLRVAANDAYDGAYAYWNFEGSAGAAVVDAPAANGESVFKLVGMSALENWSQEVGGATPPRFSNQVPGACIWDAQSGQIINPENETSVFFTNTMTLASCPAGEASHRGGSLLKTSGTPELPKIFTVEFFLRSQRGMSYGKVFGQGNGNGGWLWDVGTWWNTCDWALVMNLDSEKVSVFGNRPATDNPFAHVAVVVDQSAPDKTKIKTFWNYGTPTEAEWPSGRVLTGGATDLWLGAGGFNGNAFDGWLDEPRITAGELAPEHFMRVFMPRADLTGIWFTSGANGIERLTDGSLSYLTANFDAADIVADAEAPIEGGAKYRNGNKGIKVLDSVRFTGGKGATIPCAAVTGTKDFTLEATVKGFAGEIARKQSRSGSSWAFGIKTDGRAYLSADGEEVVSDTVVNAAKWSHVALVVDRLSGQMATLFVDGVSVATASVADLKLDGGDVLVGAGAIGKLTALRFSSGVLAPEAFFVAHKIPGMCVILR